MNIQINVEDYLSEQDIKEIVASEYANAVRIHFSSEENVKRILTNSAYETVYKRVDELCSEDMSDYLPKKVKQIITENMSAYNIFEKPDAWSRETNTAYKILEKAVVDNAHIIQDKVVEALKTCRVSYVQGTMRDAVKEYMLKKLS